MTMENHKIEKPTVFISHASSDEDFANAIKQEIEKVFADGVSVFCTSSPGTIPVGTDWLSVIEEKLEKSKTIIPLVTPTSIERPWLWFEIGATWANGRKGRTLIFPVCTEEVDLKSLPAPLDRLQALSLSRTSDLKMLFEALIEQFGFGKISTFKAQNILSRIPKYKDVKIQEIDLAEKSFYSGKYSGYTDKDLMEVIDAYLFSPDEKRFKRGSSVDKGREDLIHNGKLLHFREIDRMLELPPGTSKRLLHSVAARYNMLPSIDTENVVRYEISRS